MPAGFFLLFIAVNPHISIAEQSGSLLIMIPPIMAANQSRIQPSAPTVPGNPLTVRIYVAGESVEEFNHYTHLPFQTDGSLNTLGQDNNSQAEYGWMVPFAQRLSLRDPHIDINWVGSGCWLDQDTWECSTGTYTNSAIGKTSAMAGSTISDWNAGHGNELATKQFCYDVAFASRGGNDLNNSVPVNTYREQLRTLILDLDKGSSCRSHPIVYVTAHLLDVAGWNYGYQQSDIDDWMNTQEAYYVTVASQLVNELDGQNGMIVRFIDMWTPFRNNRTTVAFPAETWWTMDQGTGAIMPDLDKLHRPDGQHPRRLASIFAGENVADQINIPELRSILGQ